MADNYIEETRYLYLNTPLGPDKLLLLTFNGYEAISELFRFQLEVAAKKDEEIDFDKLIGKAISFGIKGTDDNEPRHFDGVCIEFSEGTRDREFKYYSIVVAPKLWMLTQRRNCRIFQQKSVQDILTTILAGLDTDVRLQVTYQPREFCVQYNESEFDFASRLMEEEGIAYYFKFAEGSHTMVLLDNPQGHQEVPGGNSYTFETQTGGNRFDDEERIGSWRRIQSWSSAKYTLWDHNFQLSDKHLESEKTINPETVSAGTKTHKLKVNGNEAFEVFEFPGNYAKRFDGISSSGGEQASELNKIFSDNARTTGIRMKQVATPDLVFSGGGNARRLAAGHKFELKQHFDADGTYVLVSVTHMAQEGDFRSGQDVNIEHYENSFTAIPLTLAYVPSRKTPRPRVFGCQTAKVVGPPGEEIFTDKYGRVKVQFRWDREGQENASSSCWLRVGTPWAGKNWGMVHIPRIGQEVMVDFMDGDPDRPIITGSVYNPDQMPPYELPANKTQSGLKSRSSKGGGPANFNEFRFEDKKGQEQLFLHAEKNMDLEVENDETHWVGHNQTITVDKDRTELVKGKETVNVNGDRHNKLDGNHFEEYAQEHSLKVGQNQNVKVGMNAGLESGMCISFKAGVNIVLEASVGITLKAGASSITISPAGIMISGTPLCLINTAAVALPGVPVVVIPPIILPPVPPIPPIAGMSGTGAGPSGPVKLASIPSIAPLPPLPNVPEMAAQVGAVVGSSLDSASQLVTSVSDQMLNQSNTVANQLMTQAQQAGNAEAGAVAAVESKVKAAVDDAKSKVAKAVEDGKKEVASAVNEVDKAAQEKLKAAAAEVKALESQAAQNLQNLQQQAQQAANQAEQLAQQAQQEGKGALAQAAQQAQNASQQAQQLASQAEHQMQEVAAMAEKAEKDAEHQGQQELTAASQQLKSAADQANQGAKQVQQQMQNAAQQTEQMAQQAMQQGEQAMAQAATQAQQAAQQAQLQAQQAAADAQAAAGKAAAQAQQQADSAVKSVEHAADDAGKKVGAAAEEGKKEISAAAQQATTAAVQEGKMAQQAATQVAGQVSNSAGNAANYVSQSAAQSFGQVGQAAGQASKGMQDAISGLGK